MGYGLKGLSGIQKMILRSIPWMMPIENMRDIRLVGLTNVTIGGVIVFTKVTHK